MDSLIEAAAAAMAPEAEHHQDFAYWREKAKAAFHVFVAALHEFEGKNDPSEPVQPIAHRFVQSHNTSTWTKRQEPSWGDMTAEEMSYNIWRGGTRMDEVCFPHWQNLSPRQRESWAEALTAARVSGIEEAAKMAEKYSASNVCAITGAEIAKAIRSLGEKHT